MNILSERKLEIPIQINGRIKTKIYVGESIDNKEIEILAKKSVEEHLSGKEIVKFIVVPKRLISIVVK